jgi:hypothetical protein
MYTTIFVLSSYWSFLIILVDLDHVDYAIRQVMNADAVSLRLLDPQLADWIRRASDDERRDFAFACADETIGCAAGAPDPETRPLALELAELRARARHSRDGDERVELDRALAVREELLHEQLAALRGARAAASRFEEARFRRLALVWYAVRALRAALAVDGVSAAGRAAFTAVAALQDEARVLGLVDGARARRGDDDTGSGASGAVGRRRA